MLSYDSHELKDCTVVKLARSEFYIHGYKCNCLFSVFLTFFSNYLEFYNLTSNIVAGFATIVVYAYGQSTKWCHNL